MVFKELSISGCWLITPAPFKDDRGYFMRCYDPALFEEKGLVTQWLQENQSLSLGAGVIRGLHFQHPPHAETKLIRVARGAILDVFVDLRTVSPTFGQWGSAELSDENFQMLYLPKGMAHGFCTLTEKALVMYKVDARYAPAHEGGIAWNDHSVNIDWPVTDPIMSLKDRNLPRLQEIKSPF